MGLCPRIFLLNLNMQHKYLIDNFYLTQERIIIIIKMRPSLENILWSHPKADWHVVLRKPQQLPSPLGRI